LNQTVDEASGDFLLFLILIDRFLWYIIGMMQDFWNFLANKTKVLNYAFNLAEHPLAILDILIVAALFYWVYKLIKGTRGMKILIGIVILGFGLMVSKITQLYTLNWILRQAVTIVLIAIPIVFQPELRRGLEKLGRAQLFSGFKNKEETSFDVLPEIIEACHLMAKKKIGSIIVIKRKTGLDDYSEQGVKIGGQVSARLILSLFSPNSPLHDGAIIIEDGEIISAGVMLPMADSENFNLGARHRAALGLASETDAIVIVTSEEKGEISVAFEGKLIQRLSVKRLGKTIKNFLKSKNSKFFQRGK